MKPEDELRASAVRRPPFRTPIAVAREMLPYIEGKSVCDLGCAEGDMLSFWFEDAQSIIGVEQDPKRYRVAQGRGFEVVVGDYLTMSLPVADVYYVWPNDGPKDNPRLMERLQGHGPCTVIFSADYGFKYEIGPLQALAQAHNGTLVDISYDEGAGTRESGMFLVCVIEVR